MSKPTMTNPEPWSMPGTPNAKYSATPPANITNTTTKTLPECPVGTTS